MFEFGETTSVHKSCALAYKNEFFVFGGTSAYGGDKRQISKISGCRLERIGTLAFDLLMGACTGVQDTRIYLCFDYTYGDFKKCRFAENPLDPFTAAASSDFCHRGTSIAASDSKSGTIFRQKF